MYIRHMQKKLVSILIPFKNTEAFISDCINSVLKQTHTYWEMIMVDDGSTDNSHHIVNTFAEKDQRITLLKNTGNGIIDALQLAFSKSEGEFITRMDSDDLMRPNKLEILVKNLVKYGKKHVATGLVKYFSDQGISNGYRKYEQWLNNLTRTGNNYSEIYKECVIPSPCWMVYRDDFLACDAFNPNRYPEDYDLTFRFYKHQFKCIPCDAILHDWRDYSYRTSRTHEHYAQNYFLDIKLHHFLDIDYNPNKTLVVWGAGFKGKQVAKTFIFKNIPFQWICDNPNKIGKAIYGEVLKPFQYLETLKNTQSIVTVANNNAQEEIKHYLQKLSLKPFEDYIFFC